MISPQRGSRWHAVCLSGGSGKHTVCLSVAVAGKAVSPHGYTGMRCYYPAWGFGQARGFPVGCGGRPCRFPARLHWKAMLLSHLGVLAGTRFACRLRWQAKPFLHTVTLECDAIKPLGGSGKHAVSLSVAVASKAISSHGYTGMRCHYPAWRFALAHCSPARLPLQATPPAASPPRRRLHSDPEAPLWSASAPRPSWALPRTDPGACAGFPATPACAARRQSWHDRH